MDPLVEKTMDAYGYVHQNPIRLIDPTGMSAEDSSELQLNLNAENNIEAIDPPKVTPGVGAIYNFGKKSKLNLFVSLNVNKTIHKSEDSKAQADLDLRLGVIFGENGNTLTLETSLGGKATQELGDVGVNSSIEFSCSFDLTNFNSKFEFKAKSYFENKLSDLNFNSVTNQIGLNYEFKNDFIKKEFKTNFAAFGQYKQSTVPSSYNPALGQNATLGASFSLLKNLFSFTAKEDASGKFNLNSF